MGFKSDIEIAPVSYTHLLGGRTNGMPREDGYDITVASEIMAVLCLASDIKDLKERLSRIIIGYTYGKAVSYTHLATASEKDMPEWGPQDERGIDMEVETAAADLAAGSDAVILRHPESVKTISKLIKALA